MTQNQAYDTARREFYKLRQAEEIERRVALEEARHVGAYFGKTRSEVGMLLEDHEFENWKIWAGKKTEAAAAAREASDGETFDVEESSSDLSAETTGDAQPSA